jgi:hypothetical protein
MALMSAPIAGPDLKQRPPRSPRDTLGGFVVAARVLDKCRALLSGTIGEYHFNCFLDRQFFEFASIDAEKFQNFVATGATDEAVADWIQANGSKRPRSEVVKWNNRMREKRIGDLPAENQEFMETYIPKFVPKGRVVYYWFDVYDLEEGRI